MYKILVQGAQGLLGYVDIPQDLGIVKSGTIQKGDYSVSGLLSIKNIEDSDIGKPVSCKYLVLRYIFNLTEISEGWFKINNLEPQEGDLKFKDDCGFVPITKEEINNLEFCKNFCQVFAIRKVKKEDITPRTISFVRANQTKNYEHLLSFTTDLEKELNSALTLISRYETMLNIKEKETEKEKENNDTRP